MTQQLHYWVFTPKIRRKKGKNEGRESGGDEPQQTMDFGKQTEAFKRDGDEGKGDPDDGY